MTKLRYFDGETWWYEQCQIAEEIGVSPLTIAKWRKVTVEGEPLIRTVKQKGKVLLPLVDVFYVLENREKLFKAGVRLTPADIREKQAEYRRTMQHISLDFAIHRGEEYSTKEIREFGDRDGTVFEASVEHGRTYYGGQYAARRARG